MFTGIISDIGRIEAADDGDGRTRRLRIACGYDPEGIDLGASIACSGVCLTVVDKGPGWFAVDVTPESQARTASGMWESGRRLNLERALRLGDELGGHIVTGHVDGVGRVVEAVADGGATNVVVETEARIAPFLAEKGSVAVDGISLTVNSVEDADERCRFSLTIIPHTAANVALFGEGEEVNIEIDILARYVARLADARK